MKLWQGILCAIGGGIIGHSSFEPYGIWPLIFLSYGVLMWVILKLDPKWSFYAGISYGVALYGLSLDWFTNIFGMGALVLYLILAFFLGIFGLLTSKLNQVLESQYLKVIMVSGLCLSLEFIRCELYFLRFPWITPGTALNVHFLLPIGGVYLVSFLTALSTILFQYKRFRLAAVLLLGLLISGKVIGPVPIFEGSVPHFEGSVPADGDSAENSLKVALIQLEQGSVDEYKEWTRKACEKSPDVVIWPEYAIPFDVRKRPALMKDLYHFCHEMGEIQILLGTQTQIGNGEKDWRNTALWIHSQGVVGEYYKCRPVHFFNDGIAGDNHHPMRTDFGTIGTPICFDGDYSFISRNMAYLGAEAFLVMSFDAEDWSHKQHLQHGVFFQIRAAENARWLVRAASSGQSQVISPSGEVIQHLEDMKPGYLVAEIDLRSERTIFTRIGWIFPWVVLVFTVIAWVFLGFSRFSIKRQDMGPNG